MVFLPYGGCVRHGQFIRQRHRNKATHDEEILGAVLSEITIYRTRITPPACAILSALIRKENQMTNFDNENPCVSAAEMLYLSADATYAADGVLNYLEAAEYFVTLIGRKSVSNPDAQARLLLDAVRASLHFDEQPDPAS